MGKMDFKKKFLNKKTIIITAVVLTVAIGAGIFFFGAKKEKAAVTMGESNSVLVTKGSIVNLVEGSGVLEANEQYDITSLVSGDILADYFSEGDMVEKDQVLYKIDSKTIEKNIEKAGNSLTQAQLSYNEAQKALEDLKCFAPCSGTITAMYIENGDKITNGAKICDIINNDVMILSLPFIASQADTLYVGQSADVEIVGDSNTYRGAVSYISGGAQTNSYGVEVKRVEIEVINPGGINGNDTATAIVGGVACASPGNFEYAENTSVYAESSGTVYNLKLDEGDKVEKNGLILNIENDSVANQATKAGLSLNDANLSKSNLQDDLEQYSIKAPIAGKIIQKNSKAGDKLGQGSQSGSSVMAVVADLSKFKLTINIDELEVTSLKVGQKATITVDALGGKMFEGVVNNISIIGTSSNGVTTYPVEIIIQAEENTQLIPGMNVDASIIIEEKKDILLLPAVAINRGNTVTVNGEKVQVEIGITDGNMVEIISGVKEGDKVTYESVVRQGVTNPMGAMMPGGMGGMPSGNMGGTQRGNAGGGTRR